MRVVVVLALLCRVAYATPPGISEEEPPVASYRAQTVLADALAGAVMFAAYNSHDDARAQALAKLGISAYVLGGPIVHLSKNRGKRALASIAMRIGLPILGGILGDGMTADNCEYYSCGNDAPSDEQMFGVLVGAVAASTIDALYLAKGDPPAPAHAALAPTARLTQGGVALGVRGSF